jgi:hypothetical protein
MPPTLPNSSSRLISGNSCRRANSSSVNTRVAMNPTSSTPTNLADSQAKHQQPRSAASTGENAIYQPMP